VTQSRVRLLCFQFTLATDLKLCDYTECNFIRSDIKWVWLYLHW